MAFVLPAMAWTEQDVSSDGLHGSLISPDNGNMSPTVLILAGSGPVDRDGNLPSIRNDSLKRVAQGLADMGIGSLRIDKRGIGKSRTPSLREEDLRIGTYADDAVRWLDVLRRRPGTGRLFILGHSEGALIATLAAQKSDIAGLILVAGAGEPTAQLIARQLSAAGVSPTLQDNSKKISESLANGVPVATVPAELMSLYRPSAQPYLISWLQLDPTAELARVKCPILIAQGTTDLQITTDDAHRLAAANQNSTLVLVPGMNHVLKTAPAERIENLKIYNMPERPLAPALLPAISAFVQSHSR